MRTTGHLVRFAQLNLFNEAEALAGADVEPACEAPPASDETGTDSPARARGKRKPIDPRLPRVRIEHDIPDAMKTCACGCQLTRISGQLRVT